MGVPHAIAHLRDCQTYHCTRWCMFPDMQHVPVCAYVAAFAGIFCPRSFSRHGFRLFVAYRKRERARETACIFPFSRKPWAGHGPSRRREKTKAIKWENLVQSIHWKFLAWASLGMLATHGACSWRGLDPRATLQWASLAASGSCAHCSVCRNFGFQTTVCLEHIQDKK